MAHSHLFKETIKVTFKMPTYFNLKEEFYPYTSIPVVKLTLKKRESLAGLVSHMSQQVLIHEEWTLMFNGLFLEDGATLAGLGIVDGDTIFVSDAWSVQTLNIGECTLNIPKQPNIKNLLPFVGNNVLIGAKEKGLDIAKQESPPLLECCKEVLWTTRRWIALVLHDNVTKESMMGVPLPTPLPDFSHILEGIDEGKYENESVVFKDYEEVLVNYPHNVTDNGNMLCEKLHSMAIQFHEELLSGHNCRTETIPDTLLDTVYVGPERNSNYNCSAFPPAVQLKGLTTNTTIQDLMFSYHKYSGKKSMPLTHLSYNNKTHSIHETVFDVIETEREVGFVKHYFSFPYDITKTQVKYVEGGGNVQTSKSKKKRGKNNKSQQSQPVVATAGNIVSECVSKIEVVEDRMVVLGDTTTELEEEVSFPHKNSSKHEEIIGAISSNAQAEVDAKHSKLNQLYKEKLDTERAICEEQSRLKVHQKRVEDIFESKSGEMKNVILVIEKSEDVIKDKMKEMNKVDVELLALEKRMIKLKQSKTELLNDCNYEDDFLQNNYQRKEKLECCIEKEMKKVKEEGRIIETMIESLNRKLIETENAIENLPNEVLTFPAKPAVEPNRLFLEFIDSQISDKEKELECSVCLEVAGAPIFMCSEMHLICSNCRTKVKACPECREVYSGKPKRHRYAEKTAEELVKLKIQRILVLESSG